MYICSPPGSHDQRSSWPQGEQGGLETNAGVNCKQAVAHSPSSPGMMDSGLSDQIYRRTNTGFGT